MDGGTGLHPDLAGQLGKRLRDDVDLHEELSYCVPLGIPHSVFRRWRDDDRAKALEFIREQNRRCGSCGTRKDEWAEDPDVYVGDIEICEGCARIEQERENDIAKRPGAKIGLLPRRAAVTKMRNANEEGL